MTQITAEYADNLLGMGYTQEWVKNVLDGAFRGYERLLHKVDQRETSRLRLSFESEMERRHKKLFMNNNWFKIKANKESRSQGKERRRRQKWRKRVWRKRQL